jgi:hypothetical protein
VPDPDLAARTLCFPADDRDLAVIAHQRAVWDMTHSRTGDGEWHEIPRLVWEPQAPGWLAYGDRHGYLVSRGPDYRVRLTRWKVHSGAGPSEDLTVTFVRDVLDHAVVVTDPMQGQIFAQAFEDGRSIVGVPGWQVRGSTRPPFPRSPADLEQIIDWHPEGASRG